MDEMNSATPDHVPPSKVHTWMLILLSWIAIFSLVSVGLLLTKASSSGLSATDITAACQNGSINALTTNLTRISDACNTVPTDATKKDTTTTVATVSGASLDGKKTDGKLPSLTLPINWSGAWNLGVFNEGILATFSATKGIYETCNECGGMPAPTRFSLTTMLVTKAELMDVDKIKASYIEKSKPDDAEYTNIVVSSSPVAGGTLVAIDGTASEQAAGGLNGPFHILRFTNASKYIELTFNEVGATNTEWLTVKNSLDWSTVK